MPGFIADNAVCTLTDNEFFRRGTLYGAFVF